MTRDLIAEQLRSYRALHGEESATVDRFISFIEKHADCFERSLAIGHITGSAWVVNVAGTHVLLTHHRKLDKWLQLGGHADGCPDVLSVAEREVFEESGLEGVVPIAAEIFDVDIHPIPARKDEAEHLHYDIRYLFRAGPNERYIVSEESHDLSWIAVEELSRYTEEPSMHRMAEKWMKRRLMGGKGGLSLREAD